MTFSSLLTQRCVIERKIISKNAYEHTVAAWSTVATDVPCRIDYMFVTSSYLSQTPNGQISGNDYVGFFNKGQDIRMGDRITWQGLVLFARPINFTFGSGGTVHHLEVMFGLQET
jgi:hypothetical protein